MRALNVLHTGKEGRERGVPPTASVLEPVPSPRKGSGKNKRIVDSFIVHE